MPEEKKPKKNIYLCPFCDSDDLKIEDKTTHMLYFCKACGMKWMESKLS